MDWYVMDMNGKIAGNGKLIYRDDDIIFVSIHSLHRISKYKGKEGEAPALISLVRARSV